MKKALVVCPYCASGCKIEFTVENNKIIKAEGANGFTNQGELCLKGYYGWEFLNDTRLLTPRLTQPLVRYKRGEPFTAVSWEEAIRFASSKLMEIREKYGPDSIFVSGCARGPGNEANYIAQKFARAVVGTNNVDCCARVCHGPSVTALEKTLGSGAMSNSIVEIEDTKCILIFGYNPADSHPIVARRIIKAKQKGAKIIVCDPRVIESARIADMHLQMKNGSNMALVNAMLNVIINEFLYDFDFVDKWCDGFEELREHMAPYTPEWAAPITWLDPEDIRKGYLKVKLLELLLFLSTLSPEDGQTPHGCTAAQVSLAEQVKACLLAEPDRTLTLKSLSQQFNVSEAQIKSSFTGVYGMSPAAYTRSQRMHCAAALLRETDRTVLDIACQFGYDNASKFARAFRDVIGVSPREYRAGAEYDSCAPQLGEKPVSLSDADVERRI